MWSFLGQTEGFLKCAYFCQPFLGHCISHLIGLGLLAGIKIHCPLKQVLLVLEFLFLKKQTVMLQVSYSYQKRLCVRDRCTLIPVQLWYLHVASTECCLDWNVRVFGAPLPALVALLLLPGKGWEGESKWRWRSDLSAFLWVDVLGMRRMPWCYLGWDFRLTLQVKNESGRIALHRIKLGMWCHNAFCSMLGGLSCWTVMGLSSQRRDSPGLLRLCGAFFVCHNDCFADWFAGSLRWLKAPSVALILKGKEAAGTW